MDNHELSRTLEDCLQLDRPPVGLAFVQSPPTDMPPVVDAAPSACTFWRRGAEGVFYAAASDHAECAIGVMTMGFPLNATLNARAQETMGLFVQLDYFSLEEVAHLPAVSKPHSGIVYGPLAEMPVAPDVVLVVASPIDAMLLAESGGTTALQDVPQLAAMGRPACAAIPRSMATGLTTLSLGCIGARTYAEIPDDKILVVLPADRLEQTVQRIETVRHANSELATMHTGKKAQFAATPVGGR